MQYQLTTPITPPLVFASEKKTGIKQTALDTLNQLLATFPDGVIRRRLPKGYTIQPVKTDPDNPAPLPLTLEDPEALKKWRFDFGRMAYTPGYGRSHHLTGAAHLVGGATLNRIHPLKPYTFPTAPRPGHARAVWWTCHIPGHSIPFSDLRQDRGEKINFPAVSFVALAPAPHHPTDNTRARAMLITEYFRRLALILSQPEPCNPDTYPTENTPTPEGWARLDLPTPAKIDVHTLIDRKGNRFPDGARLIPSYLPHTAPPPPLTLAMVPPLPPTTDAGHRPDTDTRPHIIANIFEVDTRAILFMFPDPFSPRPLPPTYAPRLSYLDTARDLPDSDPCAHVRPADLPRTPVHAYAFHLSQLRTRPMPCAINPPSPTTPEDIAAAIDAL